LLFAGTVSAAPIPIGFLTYDLGAPISGQNEITINNFTGATFGCSVDFPVCNDVTLSNILVTPNGGAPINVPGTFGPGTFNPFQLIFPSTTPFTSFLFAATISPTALLAPGTVNVSNSVSATVDANGPAILYANPATGVPEPSGILLIFSGMAFVAALRRRPGFD
jgi:hypothetical protein